MLITDIEDVQCFLEEHISGQIIEHDGNIVFKLNQKVIKVDVSDALEIPTKYVFKKNVESPCKPDNCITAEVYSCAGCLYSLISNFIEIKAELMIVCKEENKLIATYKIN